MNVGCCHVNIPQAWGDLFACGQVSTSFEIPIRGSPFAASIQFRISGHYDISSSSTDLGRSAMNDNIKSLDRTDEDVLDEEALYEEISDAELEIAAMGGRPGADTGNGKPTSTPQCCSYGKC